MTEGEIGEVGWEAAGGGGWGGSGTEGCGVAGAKGCGACNGEICRGMGLIGGVGTEGTG